MPSRVALPREKLAAALRISMVCSSSRFFRRSSRISADSALVTPGALPPSTSACRIHLRSVSALIPSRPETALIAAHCVG